MADLFQEMINDINKQTIENKDRYFNWISEGGTERILSFFEGKKKELEKDYEEVSASSFESTQEDINRIARSFFLSKHSLILALEDIEDKSKFDMNLQTKCYNLISELDTLGTKMENALLSYYEDKKFTAFPEEFRNNPNFNGISHNVSPKHYAEDIVSRLTSNFNEKDRDEAVKEYRRAENLISFYSVYKLSEKQPLTREDKEKIHAAKETLEVLSRYVKRTSNGYSITKTNWDANFDSMNRVEWKEDNGKYSPAPKRDESGNRIHPKEKENIVQTIRMQEYRYDNGGNYVFDEQNSKTTIRYTFGQFIQPIDEAARYTDDRRKGEYAIVKLSSSLTDKFTRLATDIINAIKSKGTNLVPETTLMDEFQSIPDWIKGYGDKCVIMDLRTHNIVCDVSECCEGKIKDITPEQRKKIAIKMTEEFSKNEIYLKRELNSLRIQYKDVITKSVNNNAKILLGYATLPEQNRLNAFNNIYRLMDRCEHSDDMINKWTMEEKDREFVKILNTKMTPELFHLIIQGAHSGNAIAKDVLILKETGDYYLNHESPVAPQLNIGTHGLIDIYKLNLDILKINGLEIENKDKDFRNR